MIGRGMLKLSVFVSSVLCAGALMAAANTSAATSQSQYSKYNPLKYMKDRQYYVRAGLGVGFAKPGKNQTVVWATGLTSRNLDQSSHNAAILGHISGGVAFDIASSIQLQLGLDIAHTDSFDSKGQVILGAMSPYNYKYNVSNTRIMLDSRWIYPIRKNLLPYVSFGLGYSALRSHNYTASGATFLPVIYKNKTTHNFAVQLGLGIGYLFSNNVSVSGGYQFVYAGKAEFAKGSTAAPPPAVQTIGSLTSGSVYLNNFIVDLTCKFS